MNEIPVTPATLGYPEGSEHIIYEWDYEDGVWNEAGEVMIVKMADNFLLRVAALTPITDPETGDFYSPGTQFTAYNTRDEDDERVLTFIPIPPADDHDQFDDPPETWVYPI